MQMLLFLKSLIEPLLAECVFSIGSTKHFKNKFLKFKDHFENLEGFKQEQGKQNETFLANFDQFDMVTGTNNR